MSKNILSVIPARKGSKEIPRKNVRELGCRPLVGHAIETSIKSEMIDTVALTTDSQEIAQIGRRFDTDLIIDRPDHLATDEVPLAPVVEHAFEQVGDDFEYVLCFQPTAPLVQPSTLDEGIRKGMDHGVKSLVFVTESTHHYWKETNDGFQAVSSNRKNRQLMEPIHEEIGVFLSHRDTVRNGRRVCDDPYFHSVNQWEGIDIDTYSDWLTAESYLNRKELVYRVTGNEQNGTGHIYRGITIADNLFEHDIIFAVHPTDSIAIELLEESNYDYRVFEDTESFTAFVDERSPFVVVSDILDTSIEYMQMLRDTGVRLVNFEDLGNGTDYADAVINALFEHSNPPKNHHYGFEYFCLRSEFRYAEKKREIPSVNRIMISYGGTDENNLTAMTLQALSSIEEEIFLDVVLGLGYTDHATLEQLVNSLPDNIDIEVNQQVQSMANRMEKADLLITANGRTLYEAGSLNLPVISVAQNAREQRHPYAHVSRGILSLGSADYVSEDMIRNAVIDYMEDGEKREMMRDSLANHDIRNGINRIKEIIFGETDDNW